jgi:thioredoxin-dependent peroxiredoxin
MEDLMRSALVLLLAAGCSSSSTTTTEPPPSHPLAEGTMAPEFEAPAHDGTTVKLRALRGKPVVLYFYPKDDTPGCTAEAVAFRDSLPQFASAEAEVVGISLDDLESHRQFAEAHGINFPLVVDAGGQIARRYGVDTSRGVAQRTTFVIGKDGRIARTFRDVKVAGHEVEVLAAVNALD